MREHELGYWQDQLMAAMTMTSLLEQDRESPAGQSVPGSRVLVSQELLNASRMLRHIPRLPAQNANWLHFAYGVAPDERLHQALTIHIFGLEVATSTPKQSKQHQLYTLTSIAVLYGRLIRQSSAEASLITPSYLAEQVGTTLSPDAWRKSRWAVRWRSLMEHINALDRLSIEELTRLNKLLRQYQEINKCHLNPSSRL